MSYGSTSKTDHEAVRCDRVECGHVAHMDNRMCAII